MNHDQDIAKETKETRSELDGFKGSLSTSLTTGVFDGDIDAIKKDWFKHVLINIEKLYCITEESKKENIIGLQMLRDDIKELADKINDKTYSEGENKVLVKTNIDPAIKVAIYCALAGFVGGSTAVLIACVIKVFLLK